MPGRYFIYILRCAGGVLYTGITTDPVRRFREHSGELSGGARFTRSRPPEFFEAMWSTETKSSALSLEHRIKRLTREKKLRLIGDDALLKELTGCSVEEYRREELPVI